MAEKTENRVLVRTIRIDDAQIQRLLHLLDTAGAIHASKRSETRYPFRPKSQVVEIQQPGSSDAIPFQVVTRDISSSGISFIHGGFIHVGSRCRIQLISLHGAWEVVTGTVMRCHYLESGIHDVGVNFDQAIDPSAFCPEAIRSRVLLVDDEELMIKMGQIYLEQLNAEVTLARDGKSGIQAAQTSVFDVILLDIVMPGMDGFEVLRELRQSGYTGTVAAATGLTGEMDRARCLEAGFDHYIPKPYKCDDLAKLLKSLREEPLFSSLDANGPMVDAINAFVADIPRKIRELESAVAANEMETLVAQIRSLKCQAGGFGFEPISESAAHIETALLEKKTFSDLQIDIKHLYKLCKQARITRKQSCNAANVA